MLHTTCCSTVLLLEGNINPNQQNFGLLIVLIIHSCACKWIVEYIPGSEASKKHIKFMQLIIIVQQDFESGFGVIVQCFIIFSSSQQHTVIIEIWCVNSSLICFYYSFIQYV